MRGTMEEDIWWHDDDDMVIGSLLNNYYTILLDNIESPRTLFITINKQGIPLKKWMIT